VIVEATFKVLPRPPEARIFVWPSRSLADCFDRALALRDTSVHPSFLEVLNDPAADSVGLEPGPCLVVGCTGSVAELDSAEASLAGASGGSAWRVDAVGTEPLYRALRDSPVAANEDALVARISTLPSELGALLARLESEATARRVLVEIGAHAGNGVAWCQFLGSADQRAVAWFAEWLRIQARTRCAWVVFESLPPALRSIVDPWGFSGPAVRLMSGIKRALDPGALFSPGRFVGGI
jgi:FAD/FMN-containing dehydrogenase